MFELNTNYAIWNTYMPLSLKVKVAEEIADGCITRYRTAVQWGETPHPSPAATPSPEGEGFVGTDSSAPAKASAQNDGGGQIARAADVYENVLCAENPAKRWRYMMGVLLKFYLGTEFEAVEGERWLMSQDDYDRAASKHPMNELERLKSDAGARNAVFDLLRDFKDLDRLVGNEIAARCAAYNDLLPRLVELLTMTATPEALGQLSRMEKALGEEAKKIAGQIEAVQEARKQAGK